MVGKYLFWLGKPAEVSEKEIKALRNSLSGIIDNIVIKKLKIGSKHTISNGPFIGHEGKVVSVVKNKLKLELTSLGMLVILTKQQVL